MVTFATSAENGSLLDLVFSRDSGLMEFQNGKFSVSSAVMEET